MTQKIVQPTRDARPWIYPFMTDMLVLLAFAALAASLLLHLDRGLQMVAAVFFIGAMFFCLLPLTRPSSETSQERKERRDAVRNLLLGPAIIIIAMSIIGLFSFPNDVADVLSVIIFLDLLLLIAWSILTGYFRRRNLSVRKKV